MSQCTAPIPSLSAKDSRAGAFVDGAIARPCSHSRDDYGITLRAHAADPRLASHTAGVRSLQFTVDWSSAGALSQASLDVCGSMAIGRQTVYARGFSSRLRPVTPASAPDHGHGAAPLRRKSISKHFRRPSLVYHEEGGNVPCRAGSKDPVARRAAFGLRRTRYRA